MVLGTPSQASPRSLQKTKALIPGPSGDLPVPQHLPTPKEVLGRTFPPPSPPRRLPASGTPLGAPTRVPRTTNSSFQNLPGRPPLPGHPRLVLECTEQREHAAWGLNVSPSGTPNPFPTPQIRIPPDCGSPHQARLGLD